MRIQWMPSNDDAPEWPDECADCGEEMGSKMIGKDRKARCMTCHGRRR